MRRILFASLALAASAAFAHAETVTLSFPDSGNDYIRNVSVTSGGLTADVYVRDPNGVFQIAGPYLYPGGLVSIGFSQDLSSLSFGFSVQGASDEQSLDIREDGALVQHVIFSARPPGYSGPATGDLTVTGVFNELDLVYFNLDYLRDITVTTASDATTTTPEPSSLALLGTGALSAFGVLRRRLRR